MSLVLRLFALAGLVACLPAASIPVALASPGAVTLRWTAPGDDGLIGHAFAYDLRYSVTPITASNFLSATPVPGVPAPQPSGSTETFRVANLVAGTGYYFAIKTDDEAANWSAISNVVTYSALTTATVPSPLSVWLSPPYPNPARGSARWSYSLAQDGPLEIEAFDLAGRHVRTIASGWRSAGQGEARWDLRDDDGRTLAAGIYLIRATLGGTTTVKRVVITP